LTAVKRFRITDLAFGIGTPTAGEGTSLQEDQCPATRTIVDRETLDIEENTGQFW